VQNKAKFQMAGRAKQSQFAGPVWAAGVRATTGGCPYTAKAQHLVFSASIFDERGIIRILINSCAVSIPCDRSNIIVRASDVRCWRYPIVTGAQEFFRIRISPLNRRNYVARGDAGTRSRKCVLGLAFLCVSASLREMILVAAQGRDGYCCWPLGYLFAFFFLAR